MRTIEQAKKGKGKAQYLLYEQYSKAMFNICMRMCRSREDAEDILQEAFIAAFKNMSSYAYQASFGSWLKRIVINRCITHLNKKKDDWLLIDKEIEVEDEQPDFSQIELQVNQVNTAIMTLPDGYRVISTLYLLEGYDHQEISEILGISLSTSKTQLLRAKKKIRELLEEEKSRRVYADKIGSYE